MKQAPYSLCKPIAVLYVSRVNACHKNLETTHAPVYPETTAENVAIAIAGADRVTVKAGDVSVAVRGAGDRTLQIVLGVLGTLRT